jgi:hypothetical protein
MWMMQPSQNAEHYTDREIRAWKTLMFATPQLLDNMVDRTSALHRLLEEYEIAGKKDNPSSEVVAFLREQKIVIEGENAEVRQRWAALHQLLLIIRHFLPEEEL